jgi:soluble lytic murein transglycosylase
MDEAAARSAIEVAMAREPPGPFLTRAHPELASVAFDRVARLLEVGEFEAARREARAAGLTADGADPEVVWVLAWLYNRCGAPDLGHAFARARLVDYRAHWPVGRWRFAWQVAYPKPWEGVVARESESSAIPVALTWAVMREESAFDPDAHSGASAIGLMQLLASTVRQMTRGTPIVVDDAALHKPDVSIAMGARFLGSLRTSFAGNPALAIAAYNGGGGSVRKWLNQRDGDDFDVFVERIAFDETRAYVKRVLSSEAAYAFLYAPQALDEVFALPMRIATPAAAP